MRQITIATAAAVAMIWLSTAAAQQVKVKGGAPPEEYASPLQIELPIVELAERGSVLTTELKKYMCDRVSIERLYLRRTKAKRGRDQLMLVVYVYTRPGKDKWAYVSVEIGSDHNRVAMSNTPRGRLHRWNHAYPGVAQTACRQAGSRAAWNNW